MPGKVTNFLWRVCKGCLPTSSALVMKRVNINETCPWCHNSKETDMHVLFQCDFAKTVWQMAGIQLMNPIMPHESVFDVLRRMFDGGSRDQCVQLGMYCWSIWNRRNKWVWDKANGSAFGVTAAALNLLHDWKDAQKRQRQYQSDKKEVPDRKWSRPPENWLKINVDATGAQHGYIGIGCVIRNSQGHFIGARCNRVTGNWTPKEAEALSLREALMWTKQLQLDYCIFETDSQVLALACYGEDGNSHFNTIVGDCKLGLKHFNHVLVKFVFRSANCVAHLLAQTAHSMSDLGEWHVTSPEFLNHVLESDLIE